MKKNLFLIPMLLMALALMSCSNDKPEEILPDENRQEMPENNESEENNENSDNETTDSMNIRMTIGGQTITATMENNGAACDLVSRLPLTVTLSDFNRTEKIFYPDPELSLDNTPRGCTPVPGDITIYVPWGNVAIFYKSWSHSNDLVKIGHIDGDGINVLSSQSGTIEVSIEKL